MTAALDELRRRGDLVDAMVPGAILDAMNRPAGACIPASEDPEKAAALWVASLHEVAAGNL